MMNMHNVGFLIKLIPESNWDEIYKWNSNEQKWRIENKIHQRTVCRFLWTNWMEYIVSACFPVNDVFVPTMILRECKRCVSGRSRCNSKCNRVCCVDTIVSKTQTTSIHTKTHKEQFSCSLSVNDIDIRCRTLAWSWSPITREMKSHSHFIGSVCLRYKNI